MKESERESERERRWQHLLFFFRFSMEMSKKKKSSSRQSTKLQPSSPSLPPSVKRRAIGATLLHVRYIFAWVSFPKFFFFLFLESLFSSFLSLSFPLYYPLCLQTVHASSLSSSDDVGEI